MKKTLSPHDQGVHIIMGRPYTYELNEKGNLSLKPFTPVAMELVPGEGGSATLQPVEVEASVQ